MRDVFFKLVTEFFLMFKFLHRLYIFSELHLSSSSPLGIFKSYT